jgi:hypothetical protein
MRYKVESEPFAEKVTTKFYALKRMTEIRCHHNQHASEFGWLGNFMERMSDGHASATGQYIETYCDVRGMTGVCLGLGLVVRDFKLLRTSFEVKLGGTWGSMLNLQKLLGLVECAWGSVSRKAMRIQICMTKAFTDCIWRRCLDGKQSLESWQPKYQNLTSSLSCLISLFIYISCHAVIFAMHLLDRHSPLILAGVLLFSAPSSPLTFP